MVVPIVWPGATLEDKGHVIVLLSERISSRTKSRKAFDRLFGTQSPHMIIERLLRMNSRALHDDINQAIFRLLSMDQSRFYKEQDFTVNHNMANAHNWSDGTLLCRWEKYTNKPNPHHILAQSRGGSNSPKNLWNADRGIHNDFHIIFQNLTPSEQIALVLQRFKEQFAQQFRDKIQHILKAQYPEPYCYRKGVVDISRYV